MKNVVCLLWSLLAMTAIADSKIHGLFGEPMPGGEALTLKTAVSELVPGEPVTAKVSGQITKVCQKKGCFMILVDGDTYARITFKDYGFFVPMDSAGHGAVVHGELSEMLLTTDQANHYEQDAGGSRVHTSDVREYALVASSVIIGSGEGKSHDIE